MRKTTFSLLSSLIYFGLAVFAVKQMNQDGQNCHHLAQFLTACAFFDVMAIALIAQPRVQHRSMMTPSFVRRTAKTLRFVAAALTLPCIVYWGTGEILVHPSGGLPRWTNSAIAYSKFKQQVEGEVAAKIYLGRAAAFAAHVGEKFEKQDLQLAYDYYSSYVKLCHAQWPSSYRPDARGTAVLGRILDKMGRSEEADQQYAIAEREANEFHNDKYIYVSNARIVRHMNGVSKKSLLRNFFSEFFWVDESCPTLDLGTSFTGVSMDKFFVDWRESGNTSDGVKYSGEHMRNMLSKIEMDKILISERQSMHTVEELDFGQPAFSFGYMEPRSFQELLRRCTVIIPSKTYTRLKELSEMQ